MPPGGAEEPTGSAIDLLVNPREGRLRAGWRLAGWILTVVLATTIGFAIQRELVALAPTGPATALAAVFGGVGAYAIVTGATVTYARHVDRRPPSGIGLGGRRFGGHLVLGLGIGVTMATAVFLVGMGAGIVRVVDVLVVEPAASIVPGTAIEGAVVGSLGPLVTIALLFAFYVAVGVAEEVMVRGYLLTNVAEGLAGLGPLEERAGTVLAILSTGVLFGTLHYANPSASVRSAAMITAVGVVLGWTYAVSGDLGIPVGIHVTWNFTLGAGFGFPVSGLVTPASLIDIDGTGDSVLLGGSFGPEAGLVMVVPLVLAVGLTVLWVLRTASDLSLQTDIARYGPSE